MTVHYHHRRELQLQKRDLFWGFAINEDQYFGNIDWPKLRVLIFPKCTTISNTTYHSAKLKPELYTKLYNACQNSESSCKLLQPLLSLQHAWQAALQTLAQFKHNTVKSHGVIMSPVLFSLLIKTLGSRTLLFVFLACRLQSEVSKCEC